jgi:hypothetical protein
MAAAARFSLSEAMSESPFATRSSPAAVTTTRFLPVVFVAGPAGVESPPSLEPPP